MKTESNPYISFVLPAFNEEAAVSQSIRQARETMRKLPNLSYEIIVVDDNSTDKTAEIATREKARVVRRITNGGSGASRKTGIEAAKGELIVMFDVDGTYDISKLPEMLSYFPEYDQVNGARTRETGTLKALRVPAKWFLRKFASYLARTKIPDLNTGFKIFKKDIMMKYLWVVPDGFSCVTTMTLAFLCNGHRVKYISTGYKSRIGKSKFHPVKDTAKYFTTIIRLVLFFAPMRVFGQASLLILLVGTITTIKHKMLLDYVKASDVVLLVLAVHLFSLGLIAELIISTKKS
jgi:glycosyltransferase involved in cell wall biosynthesis